MNFEYILTCNRFILYHWTLASGADQSLGHCKVQFGDQPFNLTLVYDH